MARVRKRIPGTAAEPPADLEAAKPLTRGGVARLLKCTITYVRRLEQTRQLQPAIDPETRVRTFDRREVVALLARLTKHPRKRRNGRRGGKLDEVMALRERGALAAAVFQCFKRGLGLAQVVIEAGVPADLVHELHREYLLSYDEAERVRVAKEAEERAGRECGRRARAELERARLDASIQRAALLSGGLSLHRARPS